MESDAKEDEGGNLRRCLVTGASLPREELIRFAVGPDDTVVPDLSESLPGRGFWLSAGRDVVETAIAKRLFAKGARRKVTAPEDLADRIETLLVRRCVELLGLSRRSGLAVSGFEKVKTALKSGDKMAYLIAASDGAEDGRNKMVEMSRGLNIASGLTAEELGAALGRDPVVHLVIKPGKLAQRLKAELHRLDRYRSA